MKTQGINTNEQIDKANFKYGSQEYKELSLKKMINSCFAYGGYKKGSYNFNRYIKSNETNFKNPEIFEQVYNEQVAFLEKNASVISGVYTDNEGVTYNELKFN